MIMEPTQKARVAGALAALMLTNCIAPTVLAQDVPVSLQAAQIALQAVGDSANFAIENGVLTAYTGSEKNVVILDENDFIFYQSVDEDSGEFTYFAFSPDTMETTYHLEFRYAEDLDDLQSWYEGNYAYWNAAAIATDYSEETMENVIALFATENLSDAA